MTTQQINKAQAEMIATQTAKFEAARKIRELLDEARKVAEKGGFDADDIEGEILELVSGDAE